ncbi:MAG: class A beta-lactamase [Bacteroidota bacterium]
MRSFALLLLLAFSFNTQAQLRKKIKSLAATVDGQVGVAIMDLSTKDTLLYNTNGIFAMQSVYKFPLALAVLTKVDQGKLKLNQKIKLTKANLLPDTWSPLRDKYPNGGEVTLEEVLMYTVTHSDNNGCDILFNIMKGPKYVHKYVESLGVKEMAIEATEAEMHTAWDIQFSNWCKPRAMLRLLELFYDKKLLSPASQELLWKMMEETSTGPNRIKGLLPEGTEVLHRTGLSDRNTDGKWGAVNDVGIVRRPDGKYFAIVVYVGRAKGELSELEKAIAEIALASYKSF